MTTAMTKTRTRTTDQTNETFQVSKGMTMAMGAASGLVGAWVAACFIGAMALIGGPLELVKSYFQALTGM